MTIAYREFEGIGARIFLPEGPFGTAGQTPLPNFAPGEVVAGDYEAEYVYVLFSPVATTTLNQGDFLVWDATFMAAQSLAAATQAVPGSGVGTFFLGGRRGDPAVGSGNVWSYTFTAGQTYGIWVQRAGGSLCNFTGGITAQGDTAYTTATAGALGALASGGTHAATVQNVFSALATNTFTANTTNGSVYLTNISATKSLSVGQTLSGTGIPNGAYIVDINGTLGSITMSAAATATNTSTTITSYLHTVYTTAAAASGATQLQVANVAGIYPNQTVTGTNVSSLITSITGNPGAYIINLATATTGAVPSGTALTTNSTMTYIEGMLRWPYISAQT